MIRVENLRKRYGSFEAVAGVSFHVERGEVFGFLGPNGAGKTTTMKMIAGLLRPSDGSITIAGHDLAREPLLARAALGFIPDRPYLYDKLTAFELLELVGGLHRMRWADIGARGKELLETFGLAQWADTLVESFSHGMKQRLVFAAALLPRPPILVVDEPMVGLDPRGARLVKGIFRELCASGELTVFVSTHTLDVAEEVCDRIAIMHRGKIVIGGTMEQLRAKARQPGSKLEEIFLELTEESEPGAGPAGAS